jgi:uncharacterized protein
MSQRPLGRPSRATAGGHTCNPGQFPRMYYSVCTRDATILVGRGEHGIDCETAALAFEDPFCVSCVESVKDGEERWHAIGMIEDAIALVVVHAYGGEGGDEIRIVSARRATSHERKLYDKANR